MMAVIEIVTKLIGSCGGYDVYEYTGQDGNSYTDINFWISGKASAGIPVQDISTKVLVTKLNGAGWLAFEEPVGQDYLVTIFKTM